MTTLHLRTSTGRSPLRLGFLLIPLVLACFALSPTAQAQLSPPPDGFYPNFTTAEGQNALFSLTTGVANTAVGWFSLNSDTDGSFNTGVGAATLLFNTGNQNTAIGAAALLLNTTGSSNTAVGVVALLNNTEGIENTANGFNALFNNTEGNDNTAVGKDALFNNTTGDANVAVGWFALVNNGEGTNNTAVGAGALQNNISSGNIALGTNAGGNLTTGQFNIDIGNEGVADEAGTIRIGDANHTATFIAGISGQTAAGGVAVVIDSDGKLGTLTSSARFKTEIKPMDESSQAVLALKPVTFRYKHEIDPKGIPQFGLVAEEVEKVNPDLVARDADGKPYTVRYEAVNAMLLNEFLKAHRRMEEQDKRIEELTAQLKQQAAQIQKVSAQLEASKPAPQVVNNP